MITGKSLHSSNVIFVIDRSAFLPPGNEAFASLYSGDKAKGVKFIDDPVMRLKMLSVPALGLTVTLDDNRLKIDDAQSREPTENPAPEAAAEIFERLFPGAKLAGFGLNMDLYYRFDDIIPREKLTDNFIDKDEIKSLEITDFGFQFSARNEKKRRFEQYFFKVAAPLELMVHANHHYAEKEAPGAKRLREVFDACYNDTDEIVKTIDF